MIFYCLRKNNPNSDIAILNHDYDQGNNGFGNISLHFFPHPLTFLSYKKCNDTWVPAGFIAETIPKTSPEVSSTSY
jgi:hypothetical protein